MLELMEWWRVELGVGGGVLRVEQCSAGGPGTMLVLYVQADTEEAAKYAAYKKRQRMLQTARRKNYRDQGLCRCGREIDDKAFVKCSTCRARSNEDEKRMRKRARGEVVETPPRSIAFAERKVEDRRSVLVEVYAAWLRAQTNWEFSEWLRDQLEAVGFSEPAAEVRLAAVESKRDGRAA